MSSTCSFSYTSGTRWGGILRFKDMTPHKVLKGSESANIILGFQASYIFPLLGYDGLSVTICWMNERALKNTEKQVYNLEWNRRESVSVS